MNDVIGWPVIGALDLCQTFLSRCRKAGIQPGDLLQLEEEVRGFDAVGNAPVA
ncbi:hypothetical protein IM511_09870 [Erythrobacteraceae bacterium E2-1 Yellow Sea]|nr:hypothetical protein [Erythrobacteraceae bacterium E2-1 Yellow Sea]